MPRFCESSTKNANFSDIGINEPVSPHPISPLAVSQMGPASRLFYGQRPKRVSPISDADIQLQELRNCRSLASFFSICSNLAPDLKNDSEFMKQAACIKLDVLNYVGSDLQRNSKFWDSVCSLYSKNIQNALKIRDIQYKLLMGERSNEFAVVLSVVSQYGRALQYASSELKGDEDVVMEAVKQNGLALEYASPELRDNRKVVVAAIQQNAQALQFASLRLRNDINIVRLAVKNDGRALQYASKPCQNMFRKEMQRLFLDSSKRYKLK